MQASVIHGECLDAMREMESCSVDSIVTDPPYGLSAEPDMADVLRHWLAGDDYEHRGGGFMGKSWDSFVPGPAVWRECFRVLKPGGHLVAFGGTRTYDLLSIAIRLAGFQMRDSIGFLGLLGWVYGSGFPKSLDVSKAMDRAAGAEREVIGRKPGRVPCKQESYQKNGGSWASAGGTRNVYDQDAACNVTAPATDAARQWQGWGTALKPAWEPIILARKPLASTVAATVARYGTGALNIDATRIPGVKPVIRPIESDQRNNPILHTKSASGTGETTTEGRWPANVVLSCECPDTHSPSCPVALLDAQSGAEPSRFFYTSKASRREREAGLEGMPRNGKGSTIRGLDRQPYPVRVHEPDPSIIAAYLKANRERAGLSKADIDKAMGTVTLYSWYEGRPAGTELPTPEAWLQLKAIIGFDETHDREMTETRLQEPAEPKSNSHPTVKPLALMRWLARLVTPPGGTILDPFTGSGSTGCAAVLEGFRFIGIEQDDSYCEIARRRIAHWAKQADDKQPELEVA